jgi:hypothetical protein
MSIRFDDKSVIGDADHPADLPFRRGPLSLPSDSPRVTVVIPTKNEARNLPWVFARLPRGIAEVIVVDGGSTDDTVQVAYSLRSDVVIIQQTRAGKGNALACGLAAATGDIIVTLDADGSAHPAEIVDFVTALTSGADFAKGTRFRLGGGSSDLTRLRRWGNSLLCALVNRIYKTRYSDLCYGYNAMWSHCVPHLRLPATVGETRRTGDGFEIETLITLRVAAAPLVVAEVPSCESRRIHGASNLNAIRDGLRVLRVILAERRAGSDEAMVLIPEQTPHAASAPAYPSEPLRVTEGVA